MCICDLNLGEKAFISSIGGNEKLVKRLQALGCIEGTEICLCAKAPLGDPLVLNVRGFSIALRKSDAKNILIKEA
ncbi:ferrous iron transport protein A [Hathewaya histolytica]|uniref:FeoA family protein n=1 Tax=Hathewaya histolytica TaxID=1498 RepID=A0A4U9R582_HATHI|nr:ferrous iron transport protein A [Hathewaya histolytica]VTQ86584.1 FeoA family protein [Hathewaya histolytica]